MAENETEAPESHPNPTQWWRHILGQSWVALAALVAEVVLFPVFGLQAGAPLLVANLALAVTAVTYGGGSTLIDAIKAWKGT